MGYALFRLFFSGLFFLIVFLLAARTKKISALLLIISIALLIVIWAFPIENLFMIFDSPEAVFNYAGKGEIVDLVEGESSAAMMTKANNKYSVFFTSKYKNGYKLISSSFLLKKNEKQWNSVHLCIYNVPETDDFYLRIWGMTEKEIDFSDSNNSIFLPVYEDFSDKKIVNCLLEIDYDNGYYCSLNGFIIEFD